MIDKNKFEEIERIITIILGLIAMLTLILGVIILAKMTFGVM